MNSLEDLKKIRRIMQKKDLERESNKGMKIVVGMATCGVTAGARAVYNTLVDEVSKLNNPNIILNSVGCIGECALEPIVEVYDYNKKRTTYAKVDTELAKKIINSHIINNEVLVSNLIENFK